MGFWLACLYRVHLVAVVADIGDHDDDLHPGPFRRIDLSHRDVDNIS